MAVIGRGQVMPLMCSGSRTLIGGESEPVSNTALLLVSSCPPFFLVLARAPALTLALVANLVEATVEFLAVIGFQAGGLD